VKGGHLEVLKWAREHGWPWAENVNQVLKWAWEQGCLVNRGVCHFAAKGGHLEVLR
jgi:hypothetical protein